ncbi:lytic transglycosylase domain-containing protein [Candidatus Parabeggiatoa sp. HSG14]|uniref:lytic transglycosylase domain-containing protein n=1 Tax=Candidatus Parabeggiatoa sp. HSG14 TaxID=3055593 RepID=UPI0025A8A075|nr:lytic transglycosylase domain-containing protein [Thiotrichales bacterium HSG14]
MKINLNFNLKPLKTHAITFIAGLVIGGMIWAYISSHYQIIHTPQFSDTDYKGMAWQTAKRYHIDVSLLFAIVHQESRWKPKVISPKGAIGLMQIMPSTGESFCGLSEEQLFTPKLNLDCGTRYFLQQLKEFGTVKKALCAYNAGPTRVRKLGRCPRFKETTHYTNVILTNWNGGKQ